MFEAQSVSVYYGTWFLILKEKCNSCQMLSALRSLREVSTCPTFFNYYSSSVSICPLMSECLPKSLPETFIPSNCLPLHGATIFPSILCLAYGMVSCYPGASNPALLLTTYHPSASQVSCPPPLYFHHRMLIKLKCVTLKVLLPELPRFHVPLAVI